jgi:ABC-2 type transport system ATP-binding protein
VTPAIEAVGLGRRYGQRWAVRDVEVSVTPGAVVGLVGSNGAGKSTLLHLATGLARPSEGAISVFGERPGSSPVALASVGFVAQEAPLYLPLSVGDHLTLGARMNRTWHASDAHQRCRDLGLDPAQRVGDLSGGQRAQLALTLAIAKDPALLLLDEPVANLDPLARRAFLGDLMGLAADGSTIVLSSHLLSDIERVCDHLVVMAAGRIRLAGPIDELLGRHRVITAPRLGDGAPTGCVVVTRTDTPRQTTAVVRTDRSVWDPDWSVTPIGLEGLVLAYLTEPVPPQVRLRSVGGTA